MTDNNFDIRIEETHHKNKIDSPSGTALFLQKNIRKIVQFRKIETLKIRAGGIFGEHKIRFLGENEELRITHRAFSRRLFAQGALSK